jgi:inner membrane protein
MLSFGNLGFLVVGALLPDIDTPKSFMGRIFFFISHKIDVKFGHRTFTHSLLFGLLLFLLLYAVSFYFLPQYKHFVLPLMIGFLSHIFLDYINKQGTCLFYPANIHCVLPGKNQYRIQVGSNAEWVFLGILLVCTLITYPVANRGLIKTLHWVMADIQSAVADFQDYSIGNEVFVEAIVANNLTNKKIQETFMVVGRISKNVLIIETKDKKLKTIGDYEENNFRPIKVRIQKGLPVNYIIQKMELNYCQLSTLKEYLNPKYEQRIFGTINLINKINLFDTPEYYNPIRISGQNLTLNYATYADIKQNGLENEYLTKADIMIKTTLKNGEEYNNKQQVVVPNGEQQKYHNKYDIMLTIEDQAEIIIKPNEQIEKGQIIALIERKKRELDNKEIYLANLKKQLENLSYSTDIKSKKNDLKSFVYQIQNLEKDFQKLEKENEIILGNKKKKLVLLQEQEKLQQKQFKKIELMTTKIDIDAVIQEIELLEAQQGKMPYEMKYKIDSFKDDIKYTKQEITYLEKRKISESDKIKKDIDNVELEIIDLRNKHEVKSPVSGLVVAVDFTMSLEQFIRVKITVLEREGAS